MLDLIGNKVRLGHGLTRRGFIRIGSLGLAGLSLANLLRAAETGTSGGQRKRAVILYWMAGGPSHIDTYDMKPNAPSQVRGPFRPCPTTVPGLQISELLPRQAKLADKWSLIRSLCHTNFEHADAAHWVQTGYHEKNMLGRHQLYPSQGSVVSLLRGANRPAVPAYVCIPEAYGHVRTFYQKASFLGADHDPLSSGGSALSEKYHVSNPELILRSELTINRVNDRTELQRRIGNAARVLDRDGPAQNLDRSYRRAVELVTSPRVQAAFDLDREPDKLKEYYGKNSWGQAALLARRLVEAGVTFVTINHFEAEIDWWDDHYTIEKNLRRRLPIYDQALGSLIEDLHDRGMADEVLVAAFGEFGRGPVINERDAGRGHWAKAWHALLAGGGIQGGRVIGATTSNAGEPKERPLGPGDLLATIYHSVGIDYDTTVNDRQNRPVKIAPDGEPVRELF